MYRRFIWLMFLLLLGFCFSACNSEEEIPKLGSFQLMVVRAGSYTLDLSNFSKNNQVPVDQPIVASFSTALSQSSVQSSVKLKHLSTGQFVELTFSYLDEGRTFSAMPTENLAHNEVYDLIISSDLTGENGKTFPGLHVEFTTLPELMTITSLLISDINGLTTTRVENVPVTGTTIEITFSHAIDPVYATSNYFYVAQAGKFISRQCQLLDDNKTVLISLNETLTDLKKTFFTVSSEIRGKNNELFNSYSKVFYTGKDQNSDFPILSDEELLTLVQQQTFKYFWDFAHPTSGMARERNTSGNTVTSGGTGFGIMSIIVGIERNFITRTEGVDRMNKIVSFLENSDRFHGAWPHWIDGSTGKVIPFSTKDNGGDLVETSFLVQGLLTFRQYLEPSDTIGNNLINRITTLWEGVEWDWYRKNNENVLYWHWSPNYNWEMNFAMYGYFEQQITYFLAAASPSHSIPKIVYTNGYGKNGSIVKNNLYYGYRLPLESPAPLFWVHYSYLGLKPDFTDEFANYWEQNVNESLINHAYCASNPKKFVGYSDECWGLTSSDNQSGYGAHSPSNDIGVIAPTAALSSFPYTPEESMLALKFFYYTMGDRLWGEYGFYDAFNITEDWTASSYLAIDQGPIIIMIENYRTGLLWDLFLSAPEVNNGFTVLDFTKN